MELEFCRQLSSTFYIFYPWPYKLNVQTSSRHSFNIFSIAFHVFRNLFWKIYPPFGQILIPCLKCSRASFLKPKWGRGVVIITTAQPYSAKSELRLCTVSNPAQDVSEIRDGEDIWQCSWLELKLDTFRRPIIPQKQLKEIKSLRRNVRRILNFKTNCKP